MSTATDLNDSEQTTTDGQNLSGTAQVSPAGVPNGRLAQNKNYTGSSGLPSDPTTARVPEIQEENPSGQKC